MPPSALHAARQAVSAVASLNLIEPGTWPTVATELLLLGDVRDEVAELASLPSDVDYWTVEPLVRAATEGPQPERAAALGTLVGLLVAAGRTADEPYPLTRTVAGLNRWPSATEDPSLSLAAAADAALDDLERGRAHPEVEAALAALPSPDVPVGLALALTHEVRTGCRASCPWR